MSTYIIINKRDICGILTLGIVFYDCRKPKAYSRILRVREFLFSEMLSGQAGVGHRS
jgi:hypothetical protein